MDNNKNSRRESLEDIAWREKTDKNRNGHWYSRWYETYFSKLRDSTINLLEIGLAEGCSHRMWREYFKKGNIYAIDVYDDSAVGVEGINIFLGDITDLDFVSKSLGKIQNGLDIIIDDGSHLTDHQVKTFEFLFPKMNSGGIYVIEDVMTSYWTEYRREPHLSAIDYFKSLVDCVNFNGKMLYQNYEKISDAEKEKFTYMEKNIEAIHFYAGICFIFKR